MRCGHCTKLLTTPFTLINVFPFPRIWQGTGTGELCDKVGVDQVAGDGAHLEASEEESPRNQETNIAVALPGVRMERLIPGTAGSHGSLAPVGVRDT